MIGRTIGSYRITKLLGEGGMGAVYLATDNIEREVAIKILRPQLTDDENRLSRFRAEAIALGRLHHPNIASLFHLLEENDALYMVMEYIDGHTLEELIYRNGALPPRLALEILIDGLHGFEHAHERGVIHRDIKASNLMVSSEGATKIMDFGIARIDGTAGHYAKQIGSLEYMSPEQIRGLEQDARSDIYSLGIVLFELLTGRVPFTSASEAELMQAHLEKPPPSVRFLVPSLPLALDGIIAKAIAKDPASRFQNVVELRAALEKEAADLPVSSAPTTPPATPQNRYATLPLEDRYGTRVVGTPLPVPAPAQQTAIPVVPLVATPTTSVAPPKPAPRLFNALAVIAGVALIQVGVFAWFFTHRTPSIGNTAASRAVRPAVNQPRIRANSKAILPSLGVRRNLPRVRTTIRRRTRRVERVQKNRVKAVRAKAARAKVAGAKTDKAKTIKRLPVRSGGEKAALRALIKSN